MTRAEKIARARELRERGMTYREIGEQLGVTLKTAWHWVDDPDGSKTRARKDSYRGTCATCGARTDGSNGRDSAPDECIECLRIRQHEERRWTPETVADAIRAWAEQHGRQPSTTDWRRAGPDHPSASHVQNQFDGSWNAALRAAGFEPCREFKRPYEADPVGVLAEVVARYTAGETGPTIAAHFEISDRRVYQLLDKAGVQRRTAMESRRRAEQVAA